MKAPLHALLDGIFDYAGLFPPAALPMEDAVAEYASLLHEPAEVLLNRFVCPVSWLSDLADHLPESVEDPWPIAVLGTSLEGCLQDQRLLKAFQENCSGRAEVLGYEVKAQPGDVIVPNLKAMERLGIENLFVELPWSPESNEALHLLTEFDQIGTKGRTGGLEPAAYPSLEQLAHWMHECISLDLTFKVTAGLHHPWRRKHPTMEVQEHGFLNLLLGGALAYTHDITRRELQQVLSATGGDAVQISSDCLSWHEWELETEDIEDFRGAFGGIGSCSISEPQADLASLGLW
ncbi:MAG: hypothetical protein JST40_12685 [Armatimonadetes bacterium]|nr:hypothetical protein [Armatimonadota bacterium]